MAESPVVPPGREAEIIRHARRFGGLSLEEEGEGHRYRAGRTEQLSSRPLFSKTQRGLNKMPPQLYALALMSQYAHLSNAAL